MELVFQEDITHDFVIEFVKEGDMPFWSLSSLALSLKSLCILEFHV